MNSLARSAFSLGSASGLRRFSLPTSATLLASSVLVCRSPLVEDYLREAWPNAVQASEWAQGWPPLRTLPSALLLSTPLILLGVIVLWLSFGSSRIELDQAARVLVPKRRLAELAIPLSLTIGCGAIFFMAESRGFLHTGWLLGMWVVAFITAASVLARGDRRGGVRIGVVLARTELVGLVAATIILPWTLYASGFDSWKYSFIGDEYAFYWAAESRALQTLNLTNWLEAAGVYGGDIPVLPTAVQEVSMRLFGIDNFGWRLSSAFFSVTSLVPLYLVLRHLAPTSNARRLSAAMGCAFFLFSELIVVWSRVGKPCIASVPPVVFAFVFFLAARARTSLFLYFLAGGVTGFGTHLYMLGPTVATLLLGGILLYDAAVECLRLRRFPVSAVVPTLVVSCGFLIVASPSLVQVDTLAFLLRKNLMSGEDPGTFITRVQRTLQAAVSFLSYGGSNHFLAGNVVDPLTAFWILMAFGMARRIGWGRLALVAWLTLASAVVTGGFSQYVYPSPTRIVLMMIPFSILATLGFAAFISSRIRVGRVFFTLVLGFVAMYNLVKLEQYNPYARPMPYMALFLKRAQEAPAERYPAFVFPAGTPNLYFCKLFRTIYRLEGRVGIFEDDRDGIEALKAWLRAREASASVIPHSSIANRTQLESLALEFGATLEEPLPDFARPARATGRDSPFWRVIGDCVLRAIEVVEGPLPAVD